MKLVLFSDVHGNDFMLERIMLFNPDADHFLSMGDSELTMDYLLDLDIIGVKGNYPRDPGVDYDHILMVNNKKILMTHGHKYGVQRGLNKLIKKAIEEEIDIVLFGHTHVAEVIKYNNIILLNPGSVYRSRGRNYPSYCIMNITDDGIVTFEFRESETNMVIELDEIKNNL